jgi:elongation factor G
MPVRSWRSDESPTGELLETAEKWRGELIEAIAEHDDELLELFFDGKDIPVDRLKTALRKATIAGDVLPMLCGSAFKNKGVQPLLDAVVDFLPSPLEAKSSPARIPKTTADITRKADDNQPFAALAFKIATDPYGNLTYFRVYSGVLEKGSYVYNARSGKKERIGRILRMHANHREDIDAIGAGDIAAAVGMTDTRTGDTLCDEKNPILLENIVFPEPVIFQAIEPKTKGDQDKLGIALSRLAQEDPTFRMRTDEETQQTIIGGMGELHLEIILDRLKREFKVEANVGKPQVAYKEAITKTGRSAGQVRPAVRRQGSVRRRLDPARAAAAGHRLRLREQSRRRHRSQGIRQAGRREGIREASQVGTLAGYPGARLQGDAVRRVVPRRRLVGNGVQDRGLDGVQGRQQEGRPDLARADHESRSDDAEGLPRRHQRRLESPSRQIQSQEEAPGGAVVITADVPLSEMFGYATDMRSATQGRATYTMEFSRYEKAPRSVEEEIVAKASGKKLATA